MTTRYGLLATLALLACSSSTSNAPAADATPPGDAAEDTAATPDASADVPTAGDRPATGDTGPTGPFTAVPYRSATPMRMFPGAEMILESNRDYRAVMETDVGRIVLDLYEEQTPLAVNSFVYLSLHHYYEGIAFHRVLEGFVAQGGDPNTLTDTRSRWGTGGPGYGFDTEPVDGLGFDGPGVLGMARSMALNSNGSQFFITLAAQRSLTGGYTVFGRVTEGMDVLPMIARNQSMSVPPATPTRITRVTIESRPR
jgi:peptidylprolyl isomerase